MKIAIVVLSYFDNDVYSELFKIQNETWNSIEVESVDTFFLIGNCDENKIDGNLIKTTAPEILACGEKVLKGFELLKNLNYDFIFRTNSSSYVDKNLLKKYIIENCNDETYRGIIYNHDGILFASGSGFILSKKNLELSVNNSHLWNYKDFPDDVCIGALFAKLNVYPQPGLRRDMVIGGRFLDQNHYHYRLVCYCDNRLSVEKLWFYEIHNMKLNR